MFHWSTPSDVTRVLQFGMSKTGSDPLALVRRTRLQEFCKRKGWFDHERQTWAVTEMASYFGKHRQKMSDLVGGRGSFGAKIARELEGAAQGEMAAGYLDDLAQDAPKEPKRAVVAQKPSIIDALHGLADWLQTCDGETQAQVAVALSELARFPDSLKARNAAVKAVQGADASRLPSYRDTVMEVLRSTDEANVRPTAEQMMLMIEGAHQAHVRAAIHPSDARTENL